MSPAFVSLALSSHLGAAILQALRGDMDGCREGEPGENRDPNLMLKGLIAFLNREACECA
jgi:hypothetical protein